MAYEKIRSLSGRIAGVSLDLIYPPRCPVCGKVKDLKGGKICPACSILLPHPGSNRCMKCSRPVPEGEEYCRDCLDRTHWFSEGRAVFLYEGIIRRSVLSCKYGGHPRYADFYGAAMTWEAKELFGRFRPDILVPVPMHPDKERRRGFHLTGLLCSRVSAGTGIPSMPGLLRKTVPTASQKSLSGYARRRNLAASIEAGSMEKGLRVVVIDDVYTTGSTIDACAQALIRAGAERVGFLTFAITPLSL